MKNNKIHRCFLLIILILLIMGCFAKKSSAPNEPSENIIEVDTISFLKEYEQKKDLHPFTSNPKIIRLKDSLMFVDSLKPYFRYKDVERLDVLCYQLTEEHDDSLCTVIFPIKKLRSKFRKDLFVLGEYQFLVGNLKKTSGEPDILIFLNYIEDWGNELFLVSVNKEHKILDIQIFCGHCGDGGVHIIDKLEFQDLLNYTTEQKAGNMKYGTTVDTFIYNRTRGSLSINHGFFGVLKQPVDSNIVEYIKRKVFTKNHK